jgi:hypothetical protein
LRIPNNYLAAIAQGKNGDISADDGILNVPPIVVPAFPMPRPARVTTAVDVSAADGPVLNDSAVLSIYSEHVNAAAQDDTAFFLLQGLWELEFQFFVLWAKTAAPTAGSSVLNFDVMDQAGSRVNLVSMFSDGATGSYKEFFRYRFHIQPRPDLSVVQGDVWTFFFGFAATNVNATDKIQVQIGLNAQKFL